MTKATRATHVEQRLNRAAKVAEAINQSKIARAELEGDRGQEYTGKHRKP